MGFVVMVRGCSWEMWGVYVWWWMGNTWSTREFAFFGKLPRTSLSLIRE